MANRDHLKVVANTRRWGSPNRDYSLFCVILFLLGFGMIMMYSASSYDAAVSSETNETTSYLISQASNTLLGVAIMLAVSRIPYHWWKRWAIISYIVSIILILLVLTPLGYSANGATRWLDLGFSVQPAEVAKAAIILFLATAMSGLGDALNEKKVFWIMFCVPLPISILVWTITDNMSSAIIIMGIGVVMLFVATKKYKEFILLAISGMVVSASVIWWVVKRAAEDVEMNFRANRILAWLDPESMAQDTGFQTMQSLYAIGSGGIFGKGLGQSLQKLGFLPETQNDMIFAIICEELGLFGAAFVILLFIILLWRCMYVAVNAEDLYGALLVVGVMAHIAIQVVLNIAVVTNTVPNTGISLPFISYGGSAMVVLLGEMGLVLSVERGIRL